MKIITKRNFISVTCITYTFISVLKLLLETAVGIFDKYYAFNFLTIFSLSVLAVFILSLHFYFQALPLLPVIIGQYLALIGIVMLILRICSYVTKVEEGGYMEMFWQVSVSYLVGAIIYYIQFYRQLRKANQNLQEIKTYKK